MTTPDYLHGYSSDEQRRLIDQAEYWRAKIISPGLGYRAGDRLLDIGCGVGAVLGVLGRDYPGLRLAGVDLEPRQIEVARGHLSRLGLDGADLRAGDARSLPWPDASFDHVFTMWFIEHLADPTPVLAEARRVLRPGGTITSIETDYDVFCVWPRSADFAELAAAQSAHFARSGTDAPGLRLGGLLRDAGFAGLRVDAAALHVSAATDPAGLRAHVDYIAGFMGPALPALARLPGAAPAATLARGLEHFRSVPDHPEGAVTNVVYRARATRP